MSTAEPWDVIVAGAGLAGLVAARDLAERGLSVAVFEARERVGGRTWSRVFPDTGTTVDLGAEWVEPTHHAAIMAEYGRYGVELLPARAVDRDRIWLLGDETRTGDLPLDGPDRAAFDTFMAALVDEAASLAGRPAFTTPPDVEVPFADRLAGLPPRAAQVLSVFATSVMGALPTEVSVAGLLDDMAGLGDPDPSDDEDADGFAGSSQRRVEGGTGTLADRIAADFGARLFLGAPVAAVAQDADGVTVTLADGTAHRARGLVAAVPVNTLADIAFSPVLPQDVEALAQQKHTGRAVKAIARVSGVPGDLALSMWPPVLTGAIGIGAAQADSDDALVICFGLPETLDPAAPDALTAQLRRAHPEARVVDVLCHDWNADPHARGTWFAPKPGQWPLLAAFQEPHGRVVFAGSDISPTSLGYMDGAVVSGRAAAERVRTLLGS
ncbi:flavin monoamine oxidase family protein [Yinghuangia seranimata]|uniref:flavin monoamine oxidase family protein n=1 Tax=Yinghuangia seranimata TaxID=408067 RepID=UPI00248C14A9|nr:NAD(P)/FAD-dependent oxidoreductase [Yinghuangia seranimata]MDI2126527.1 NAD(P)/FAD-dependent oxidoreductase [Yinghuangia seranimata]